MAPDESNQVKRFSLTTGLKTLVVYTIVLSLVALGRGTVTSPDFGQRVALVALSGFLVGFFLDPLARAMRGSSWSRFGLLAVLIFSLSTLSNALETILYLPATAVGGILIGGIVQTVTLAGVLAWATRRAADDDTEDTSAIDRGQQVAFVSILAVAWLPVYFLFVALDTPVVHWLQYGSSDVFAHPSLVLMIGLELARGLVHALAMVGVAMLAKGRSLNTWLWGSLAIAILNGWLPILPTSTLPLGVRIANGFEITLSSVTFAGIAAYLFAWMARHRTDPARAS